MLHALRRSPGLFAAIAGADVPELQLQQRLRKRYPADLVRAAMTLYELRNRAAAKFPRADGMWFDRAGLEQATAEAVARHKAERFHSAAGELVGDLCCGIGGDSIALAQHADVLAVDSSPLRCLMARWNAAAYGIADRMHVLCADVAGWDRFPRLVHIDPDRRNSPRSASSGRTRRVEHSRPGLGFLHRLMQRTGGGAIKLSPASNFAGSFRDVEFELVSLDGECKECTVWFGEAGQPGLWRATVLPAGETLAGHPLDADSEVGGLQRYLYDPDPGVVRAGLVDLLAQRLGLRRLDAEEEYLTGDALTASPFVSAFEVLAELPNNEREIRRYFRGGDFEQVEIKCRRIPVHADALRRKLDLSGTRPAVLIFARIDGKARAVPARRVT